MHRAGLVLIRIAVVCALLLAADVAAADHDCDLTNNCEIWDEGQGQCVSVCNLEQTYCAGNAYCKPYCDPTLCQDRRKDGSGNWVCVDRCTETGHVCNGSNSCQCPEGQTDWNG